MNKQLDTIGSITVKEIYDVTAKHFDKVNLNYLNIGVNLVSWGLIARNYNKYIHSQPYPAGATAKELAVYRQVRHIGRIWFLTVVVPIFCNFFTLTV